MTPLTAATLRGTWVCPLLPIQADDSIDFGALAAQIDYLVASGVQGLYTNGTAGEFYAQTEDECDRVQALVAEKCERARLPFQLGASHMSAQVSLGRVRRAAALRPGAIQVILPDWWPPSDAEAVAALARFAEAAAPVPLMLYNPPHAKRVLQPTDYRALVAGVPALIGLKVLGGDAAWYAAMQEYAGRLALFVPGHHLATGVGLGAHGSYSNVACLHPRGAARWYGQMQHDRPAALDLERRIKGFIVDQLVPAARAGSYSNQALDKLLAAIGGWGNAGTRLRWPYRGFPPEAVPALQVVARQALPELWE